MAKPRNIGNKIKELKLNGYTFTQIKNELKCSKATICYHLSNEQKDKNYKRTTNRRNQHPYVRKIDLFKKTITSKKNNLHNGSHSDKILMYKKLYNFCNKKGNKMTNINFTLEDVINKFGENPKCGLTGKSIDITKPRTYQFDHIIPRAKGGNNSLDNLQIVTKQANFAKRDLSEDEFLELCKSVVENKGYKITKNH